MNSRPGSLPHLYAVILAGGRGTRFWPRSRTKLPKQFLPFLGEKSLLEQTVERLEPLIPPERVWVLTNEVLRRQAARRLPQVPRRQIIAEPVQRNTAPAIALAARLLLEQDPNAVMGVFPSDHLIEKAPTFLNVVRRAVKAAQADKLVVLGLQPKWPETGYGYIEFPRATKPGGRKPQPVVRFREKPNTATARRFTKAGNFYWNSGMFVWQARTIWRAVECYLPGTAAALGDLPGPRSKRLSQKLRANYPRCESISIDYGVLERADNIVGFPCGDLGWSDVGSWEAVYKLQAGGRTNNVMRSEARTIDAEGNYIDAPGKLAALIGVRNLIVVETRDALLICRREDAQRVAEMVKDLATERRDDLL